MTLSEIRAEVMALPEAQRELLLIDIGESLLPEKSPGVRYTQEELDQAQLDVAERRLHEYERGETGSVDADEAIERLRRKHAGEGPR